MRKSLHDSLKHRLKEALLNMHEDPNGKNILKDFEARRFIETRDDDYEPVYQYAREIHLDLATYDYMNQ